MQTGRIGTRHLDLVDGVRICVYARLASWPAG